MTQEYHILTTCDKSVLKQLEQIQIIKDHEIFEAKKRQNEINNTRLFQGPHRKVGIIVIKGLKDNFISFYHKLDQIATNDGWICSGDICYKSFPSGASLSHILHKFKLLVDRISTEDDIICKYLYHYDYDKQHNYYIKVHDADKVVNKVTFLNLTT